MKKNFSIALAWFLVCLITSGVFAQTENEGPFSTIIVTANKIQEDIQKVPQSISVFTQMDIEEKGISSVADVIAEIPNMQVLTNHSYDGTKITFRGVSTSVFTGNNPVVIYVDGVPVTNRFGFDFSMANIERIEVLRGPQGTLFGRDAAGAVINVITKDAEDIWRGNINAEYGKWNTADSRFNISGPFINGKLSAGINGEYRRTDGWMTNDYPGMDNDVSREDQYTLNGHILYQPSDRLRFRLSLITDDSRNHAGHDQAEPGTPSLDQFDRDKILQLDVEPLEKIRNNAYNLIVGYNFDTMKLESITSHRNRTMRGTYDADSGIDPLYAGLEIFADMELSSLNEEIRLTSTNTQGLHWVVGLYIERETDDYNHYGQQFPDVAGPAEMDAVSDTCTDTQAIFGQIMVPFAQNFEITLGGRYQRLKKEMNLDMFYLPVGTSGPPMSSVKWETTWTAFLPKAAISWEFLENWTAYASWAHGYMPGGFNIFAMDDNKASNTFEPQNSASYEIGVKAGYNTWRLSAAAFYMDITDIHVYKVVNGMYLADNADKAHSLGLEFEGAWRPMRGLDISGSFAIMNAKYDDYDIGFANFDGEHIEGSPSHFAHLSVNYHHPSGWYGLASLRHVGSTWYYDANALQLKKESPYTTVSLRLGVLYKNWDFYGFVTNITDESYITYLKSFPINSVASFGAPRTFGVGISLHF